MAASQIETASLTVIVPSYKSEHLGAVLESVRDLGAAETIVVDSSPEPPSPAGDVTLKHPGERTNPGTARNQGAEQAKGDYLLFVDSDVVLTDGARRFIRSYLENPDVRNDHPIVCGIYVSDKTANNIYAEFQNNVLDYRMFRRRREATRHRSSSHFLIRRDIFERIGGFNPELETFEDIEFFARCSRFGFSTSTEPEFTAFHLKRYSFMGLLGDYARKAFNGFRARRRQPRLFDGYDLNLGPAISCSWIAGGMLPVILAVAAIVPGAQQGALILAALFACAPILLWGTVFKGASPAVKGMSLVLWPAIGGSVMCATAWAAISWLSRAVIQNLLALSDWIRAGVRVLLRYGMPVQIVNYVTARCNLRCEHCFYKDTLDAPDPGELPLEVIERTMREIGPVLWYSLAGGEPFLRNDLVELICLAQKHCRPKVFSFPTNGWYVERTFRTTLRALQKLERGNIILFFSLDGPREVHDKIRGEGSFDKVKQSMERLRPLQAIYPNLYLNVVTTVTPQNADAMPGFIGELVRDFDPNAISINLFRYHALEHPPVPGAVIDAYDKTVRVYEGFLKEGGLKHYGFIGRRVLAIKEILQKELIYRVAKNDEFVTPCTAGTLSYVIMEDGRVSPCEILADTIGSISDPVSGNSFFRMVRSGKARALRNWIRESECRCTYECAMSTNTLFSWPLAGRLYGRLAKSFLSRA